MKLLAIAVVMVTARVAHATGPCENVGPRYDPPELFDDKTRSFAIPVSQPWCDVEWQGGAVDENRGAVAFVELRDVDNHVIGVLSAAQGADAEHLQRAVGAFEAVPRKFHAAIVARGYAPLVPRARDCKLTTAWTDVDPEKPRGWRGATLQLDVTRGGKRLLRVQLGRGNAERRGDQFIRVHAMAKQSSLAVFAIVPSCAGPPPGYFGPDDGGDCYHVNTPVALLLDARAHPELAACF
jgi:hypothetical protein